MKLSSLIKPKLVRCGLASTTKDEALHELVQLLVEEQPELSAAEIIQALADRERQGPFSMGKGIAFPHARSERVADLTIAIATAPSGLDFKAADGNIVRVVVLFVIPKKHSNLYLEALASFLNVLASDAALARVLEAKTPEALLAALDAVAPSNGTQGTKDVRAGKS